MFTPVFTRRRITKAPYLAASKSWPLREVVGLGVFNLSEKNVGEVFILGFFFFFGGDFFSFFGPLVPWSSNPLVPWSSRPPSSRPLIVWSPVPCSSGPLVLWSPGPLVPWSPGPLVLWSVPCSSGLLVPWSSVLFLSFFSNLSFTLFYYQFYIFTLSCVC